MKREKYRGSQSVGRSVRREEREKRADGILTLSFSFSPPTIAQGLDPSKITTVYVRKRSREADSEASRMREDGKRRETERK